MTPLIELTNVCRTFTQGKETVIALGGITLKVEKGEFLALVGASGSGKSTLMNILGCLDRPTSGTYRLSGQTVTDSDENVLADVRRRRIGFVFQRYHLLGSLSALSNVEVPAIYDGVPKHIRRARASQLLDELGLHDRKSHRPSEMSGGQQQRVSIARALMNGGEIILADEPTGALDTKSGAAVMGLLKKLHQQGHTVILVTHDVTVANHAERIIEMNDGVVSSDNRQHRPYCREFGTGLSGTPYTVRWGGFVTRASEAARIALKSLMAHRLRASLTLFGIVVGILAVIAVVGLGEGGRRMVLNQINSLGVNSISVLPGTGWDDQNAKNIDTLTSEDAAAIAKQTYVSSVSPLVTDTARVKYENQTIDGTINGVSNAFFDSPQYSFSFGGYFHETDDLSAPQEAIIDHNARSIFFGNSRNPVGEIIVVKEVPYVVVGVIGELSGALGHDKRPQVYVPYTSMFARISGSQRLSEIVVRAKPDFDIKIAEEALIALLEKRHGARDFFTSNSEQLRRMFETSTRTLSILVSSIAAVALLVGGVGIMNIMLVSITERTNEIGLRIAVGARSTDIMMQFLIEALTITGFGSALGVTLALGLGQLTAYVSTPIPMIISREAIFIGCCSATLIGTIFGYIPARKAAKMAPALALARD